jgi:mannose-1-phosphate guanylyltransferase
MLHCVVMAGGSGTRFWPQSRRTMPKQFLRIGAQQSLIQQAVARLDGLAPPENIWVVTGAGHVAEARRQLSAVPADRFLAEPCGRNTAPCIGLAAVRLLAEDPDAVMVVTPADHLIEPVEAFHGAVRAACRLVADQPQSLVLFGVPPTYPATGFGYLRRGEPLAAPPGAYRVATFQEKPDQATAERYLASGESLWNCGIFVWSATAIVEALAEHEPAIGQRLERLRRGWDSGRWDAAVAEELPAMPSISIDYAVLERSANVCVLEAPFTWDDVGSWQALARLIAPDDAGNAVDGLFCGVNARGCIVRGAGDHLIAAAGVDDLIIVHTSDATLVARKDDEAALRRLVSELESRGLEAFL